MYSTKRFSIAFTLFAGLAMCALPPTAQSEDWKAAVGAQSKDMARQVIAFLPNEIWIHEFDTITWTSGSDDIHTVTFLKAAQPVTPFFVGCPGFSASGAIFDGSTCVTTAPLAKGQSFEVKFPRPGNFKVVCLVHSHMTGVIHVLPMSVPLPHTQTFYDRQAEVQQQTLLADTDYQNKHHGTMNWSDMLAVHILPGRHYVVAGTGEMAATPAGFQSLSVVRFYNGIIEVKSGDTVEWGNIDPAMPHTITLGLEPANPGPPSANVFTDPDGALHANVSSPTDSVHSGLLVGAPQDHTGAPQNPPGITRFRVTFKEPGTYDYKCALHDNLGMVGKVIVH